jgi:predicted nucleic acid-binding protein
MARRAKVLDSWALMALFQGEEPAAGKVEEVLAQAHETGAALFMTAVNLGEVWYCSARARSESVADERVSDVMKLGVEVVPADWGLSRHAAQFKVRGGLSYADCFALALAKIKKAELVTGDAEFKVFEGDVRMRWV